MDDLIIVLFLIRVYVCVCVLLQCVVYAYERASIVFLCPLVDLFPVTLMLQNQLEMLRQGKKKQNPYLPVILIVSKRASPLHTLMGFTVTAGCLVLFVF